MDDAVGYDGYFGIAPDKERVTKVKEEDEEGDEKGFIHFPIGGVKKIVAEKGEKHQGAKLVCVIESDQVV